MKSNTLLLLTGYGLIMPRKRTMITVMSYSRHIFNRNRPQPCRIRKLHTKPLFHLGVKALYRYAIDRSDHPFPLRFFTLIVRCCIFGEDLNQLPEPRTIAGIPFADLQSFLFYSINIHNGKPFMLSAKAAFIDRLYHICLFRATKEPLLP